MGLKVNSLWALLGLPLGIVSLLFEIYRYSNKQKVNLKDKVVFITGASSGLGAACAEVFFDAGCKVILSGRQAQKLHQLKDRLMAKKTATDNIPAVVIIDLEDLHSIPDKIKQVVSTFGHVDILINNAGMGYRGQAMNTKLDVDRCLMNVNYFGHLEITRALLAPMIHQGSGHIVTVSSVQGRIAVPHRSAYAASKHALQAFFDSLRAELSPHNINVTVVSPTYINTNLSLNALTGDGMHYNQMDEATKSGLEPKYVASQILKCVLNKTDELTLAPFYMKLAICLRAMAPWLFFKIMECRAAKYNSIKDK